MNALEHGHQLMRRRDAEDAFERAFRGRASKEDWEHIAWEMGIHDHYKRLSTKEKIHEMAR